MIERPKYLENLFSAGHPLQIEGLKASSQLAPEEVQCVHVAFAKLGDAYLKPVFDALEGNVPYEELHLWRLIFQVERAEEKVHNGMTTK